MAYIFGPESIADNNELSYGGLKVAIFLVYYLTVLSPYFLDFYPFFLHETHTHN